MKVLADLQLTESLRSALQAAHERMTAECRVDRMVLFDSVVRGEPDEESDPDLLVVLMERPTHQIRDRITRLILDVNLEHDTNLSELIVDRETWDRGLPSALPIHLNIPREVMEQQAVDKGVIQFFELAYLEVKIETPKKHTVTVTLADFVIPNTELIPEEVRTKVKKWSDYIDYWAVDWHFQNDTFTQGWVTYRTHKDRALALTADPHTYDKAGRYRILVKVVDIFGNDTTQVYDVEV